MSNVIQIFKVSDFLEWQRGGTLTLSPSFQRRPVWRPAAKSFLIDTVARGLPIPLVFVRERIELRNQKTIREVVDGQQRLRTIFTFIDPTCLPDYDSERDHFDVMAKHNPDFADRGFRSLSEASQSKILGYEFGTYVLPPETEDRDVLMIFARMNSTGVRLNGQELRNAEFFGEFKRLMYELALEQLDRWRAWRVFDEESIARMEEVEFVSDVALSVISRAVTGKTQRRLNALYRQFDETFPGGVVFSSRLRRVMEIIDETLAEEIPTSVFRSPVNFFSLWALVYELQYGFESQLIGQARPNRISQTRLRSAVLLASDRIRNEDVPDEVLDAIRRASSDTGRRQERHKFLLSCYEQER